MSGETGSSSTVAPLRIFGDSISNVATSMLMCAAKQTAAAGFHTTPPSADSGVVSMSLSHLFYSLRLLYFLSFPQVLCFHHWLGIWTQQSKTASCLGSKMTSHFLCALLVSFLVKTEKWNPVKADLSQPVGRDSLALVFGSSTCCRLGN